MEITSVSQVRRLPSNITAQQLDEMLSGDATTFGQVVAAEALAPTPYGVTAWLRSEANIVDWVNELTIKTVEHQILHWRIRRGVDPRPARTVGSRLDRFRARLNEAVILLNAVTTTRRQSTSVSQATQRLCEMHPQEYAEILDGFKERNAAAWTMELDDQAERLLAMSNEEFAVIVREDMEELADAREEEALAHPAVSKRWRDTLITLGDTTMGALGLDGEASEAGSRLPYVIRDRYLPDSPTGSEEEQWIRRLIFLSHVQARLTECRTVRRDYARQMGELVYEPAEEELRRRFFVDYARLRIEEEQTVAAKPPPSPPGPARFGELAEALRGCGWEVTATLTDRCAWLEARRDHDLISARASRRSGTAEGWRPPRYFVCQRGRNLWHKLETFGDVLALARLEPRDHLAALNRLPSYQVVDPAYHFVIPRYRKD